MGLKKSKSRKESHDEIEESDRECCPEIKRVVGRFFGTPGSDWIKMEPELPLPKDVVKFDDKLKGDPIYIGRVLHGNNVVIGTAIPSNNICLYFYENALHSKTSYEVLVSCSKRDIEFQRNDPNAEEDLRLDSGLKRGIKREDLDVYDGDEILYVGRYVDGADAYYGWIDSSSNVLYVPRNPAEGPAVIKDNFDALIHKFKYMLHYDPVPPGY